MINYYNSIHKSSKVLGKIELEEFLNLIRSGGNFKQLILDARKFKKEGNDEAFDRIKKTMVIAFTLNFVFNKSRKVKHLNKEEKTGVIYIDVDGNTNIDLTNPYIHACWLSFSANGLGILVRVSNLTIENFKQTYESVSKLIGVDKDKYAGKPNQLTVLSYDKNLHYKSYSLVYNAEENYQKHPQNSNYKTHNNTVVNVLGGLRPTVRFNNLLEYQNKYIDIGDKPFFDNGHKVQLSKVHTNFNIPEGKRYNILNAIGYQFRALNPFADDALLSGFILGLNRLRCKPPLPNEEIHNLIENILEIPSEELKPIENYSRRFFFNDAYELTAKDKRCFVMRKINDGRRQKSITDIKNAIDKWDYDRNGKITQKKLAKESGKNIKTIEKYYPKFKSKIKILNDLNSKKPP